MSESSATPSISPEEHYSRSLSNPPSDHRKEFASAEPLPDSPHPGVPIPPLPPPAHLPPPEPIALLPKNTPKRFKFPLTLILILVIILTLGVITYLALLNQRLSSQIISLESQLRSATTTPTPTAKLKDYINTDYGFSLSFPAQTSFEVDSLPDSNTLTLVFEKGLPEEFTFTATKKFAPGDSDYYFDTSPTGQQIIAGLVWRAFYLPPISSPSVTTKDNPPSGFALRLVQNNILYTIFLPNHSDTTALVDQVLPTIKFTSTSPSPSPIEFLNYSPQVTAN